MKNTVKLIFGMFAFLAAFNYISCQDPENSGEDIPNVTLPGTSGSSSNPNDIFASERFFSAYIRLILYEIVTKSYSIPMFSRPRIKNWRNSITRFIIPKTGSTVVFLFE